MANGPSLAERLERLTAGDEEEQRSLLQHAETLGAVHRCDRCGKMIVEPEATAEAAAEQCDGVDADDQPAIVEAIRASGVEVGDPLSPNFCSYHAQVTSE